MNRRRFWLTVAVGAAVVFALAAYLMRPAPRPPRTISDARFTTAAVALCRDQIPRLRADPTQNRTEERNERETAQRVERAADGLADLVDDLAGVPVRAGDKPEVEQWLDDWRDYIDAGRRYAPAVRSGDADAFSREAEASRASLERVGRFARANRIDACILR